MLFISHSTPDDAFVHDLREVLADHGVYSWIDSRQLAGGDPLEPKIKKALDDSSAYAVLISPASLQSKWVAKELQYAIQLQKARGKEKFPVIPLALNGTKLGAFEVFFDTEPIFIAVSSAAGGIDNAMPAILAALGRPPVDVPAGAQPTAQPLEELSLELTDLKFYEEGGIRRASAHAELVYEPAEPGKRPVTSTQSWRFIAPLGPIEFDEIRWYLEQYAIWPSGVFKDRAQNVEQKLVEWGQLLHQAAFPIQHVANVLQAWAGIDEQAGRRFSVHVDAKVEAGTPKELLDTAREAATVLLALPWELLHDGGGFLFQGAKPVRVRRRLPNTQSLDVQVMTPPIRILLVTARPEDDACGYIDHRVSALPLVQAMEELGGLVRMTVLSPPTLPELRDELDRARKDGKPYHVVHFDGHGVYDRRVGLGGLCFEDPQDNDKLAGRRHMTVYTSDLGPLLRDHRIPLVFLEACQTAAAEKASESVASELLKVGVASVVAMSHSVLVETARRFVEAFYAALAHGERVGSAMLAGQRALKDDTLRGHIFGAGELRMEDWFVPVLFQEKEDPQLFRQPPSAPVQDTLRLAHAARMGELPPPPTTGFIGRSRELLALQRLLRHDQYAVVRGQGGEGKTTLAAEFARWMVRSHQVRRAAFVSVETHSDAKAVLDAIGRQLVGKTYSVAAFDDLDKAIPPVERELKERPTLLVVDNMESVLLPPYLEASEALSEEASRELTAILTLCERLLQSKNTRLIFTSREPLPAPFDAERHRRELHRLAREDAVKLVERSLNAAAGPGAAADAARESIEALVDAVHAHARTLALLAPSLRANGVDATHESLVELMAEMDQRFPGSREKSLFASVELSLRRMSPPSRERARVLGVFHGGVNLAVLRIMMKWGDEEVSPLAQELIETGLATPDRYQHLTLNPALSPYLRGQMDPAEYEALKARWGEAMKAYLGFLDQQHSQNAEIAATLTLLELPNLFALLAQVHGTQDAAATIGLATSMFSLLQMLGKPRLLERVGRVRDAAAATLGDARSHAQFEARRTRIGQQIANGRLREALDSAQVLLRDTRELGGGAYDGADYDLAMACDLLATVLRDAGGVEQALLLWDEAQGRFETISHTRGGGAAEGMVSACITQRGDCLMMLGRLDEAAAANEEGIRRDEHRGSQRDVAVAKGNLGTVRLLQRRYKDALGAYEEARERFERLDEPGSVATSWHQIGMVYEEAGQPEAAEDAYRKSLAIEVRIGNVAGQASTLGQLGNLYGSALNRGEEAAAFYRQAADKYVEMRDAAGEGRARNNLADTLRKLGRLAEARQEILRAVECNKQFGHSAQPWSTWKILADIEAAAGNATAAKEAKSNAAACYLAYRRDGGENHNWPGRLCLEVTRQLLAGESAAPASLLQKFGARPDIDGPARVFLQALQAIVAGSRDRSLADAPELHPTMAAEILFLIETLQKPVE